MVPILGFLLSVGCHSVKTRLWSMRSGQKKVGALSMWSFPFSGLTHRHRLANTHPHTALLLVLFLSRLPACSASLIKMHWCDCLKVQYVQNAGQMNAACVWILCMFIWVWKGTGSRGVTIDLGVFTGLTTAWSKKVSDDLNCCRNYSQSRANYHVWKYKFEPEDKLKPWSRL